MKRSMSITTMGDGLLITDRKQRESIRETSENELCNVYLRSHEIDQILEYIDKNKHGYIEDVIEQSHVPECRCRECGMTEQSCRHKVTGPSKYAIGDVRLPVLLRESTIDGIEIKGDVVFIKGTDHQIGIRSKMNRGFIEVQRPNIVYDMKDNDKYRDKLPDV